MDALLVRPDGIVARVAEGGAADDRLASALVRWFGPAADSAVDRTGQAITG